LYLACAEKDKDRQHEAIVKAIASLEAGLANVPM
jgi:hypothetical protein